MFDNLMVVTIIIVVIWLAFIGFYLYTSSQQRQLQKDIESLEEMMDKTDVGM